MTLANTNKILIVEDDNKIATLLLQLINEIDDTAECTVFDKSGEAYRHAAENEINLFILDIQLLDYKGTSLAKQIRELPQYKFTPIIFASALAGEELSMYRDVKCHSFLIKPFTKDEFKKAFSEALEMSNRMQVAPKTLRIEQKQFIFEYQLPSIVYIESFGKKITIHTKHGDTLNADSISGYSLARLLEMLPAADFVQCTRATS
jgi:two-component system LytT family response regulator